MTVRTVTRRHHPQSGHAGGDRRHRSFQQADESQRVGQPRPVTRPLQPSAPPVPTRPDENRATGVASRDIDTNRDDDPFAEQRRAGCGRGYATSTVARHAAGRPIRSAVPRHPPGWDPAAPSARRNAHHVHHAALPSAAAGRRTAPPAPRPSRRRWFSVADAMMRLIDDHQIPRRRVPVPRARGRTWRNPSTSGTAPWHRTGCRRVPGHDGPAAGSRHRRWR